MDQCKKCRNPMTFAEQRRQWGRLVRMGMGHKEAGRMMPLCQKCTTQAIAHSTPTVSPSAIGTGGHKWNRPTLPTPANRSE